MPKENEPKCSFCHKPKAQTKVLIRSMTDKDKYICDSCVKSFKER